MHNGLFKFIQKKNTFMMEAIKANALRALRHCERKREKEILLGARNVLNLRQQ